MTDIVDTIAENIAARLKNLTTAGENVFRDRDVAFDRAVDLPAIDIRVGSETPNEQGAFGLYAADVTISVDFYVSAETEKQSSTLLTLREAAQALIMTSPFDLGLSPRVQAIRPAGASEIINFDQGVRPLGYLSTQYRVSLIVDLDSRDTLS